MDLSIVIPVFNEEESIAPLYQAVTRAVRPLQLEYEIILVDDGSTDKTFDRAFRFAKKNSELKIVQLNRNYGQSAALNAGIETPYANVGVQHITLIRPFLKLFSIPCLSARSTRD